MKIKIKFFFLLFFLLSSCQNQKPQWSSYVLNTLWIPQLAKDIHYYENKGTYQIQYKVKECYPATNFISEIVKEMTQKGWKRLTYDFLNPKIKLNHARPPNGSWDHFINEKGENTYQWLEDWEDSQKNIVWYGLTYLVPTNKFEKECSLVVSTGFIPYNLR